MSSRNAKQKKAYYRMPDGHKSLTLADKEFESTIKQAIPAALQNAGKMLMKGLRNIDDIEAGK